MTSHVAFSPPSADTDLQEHGNHFAPRFDGSGLVTAIAVDHASRQILMVAHMNDDAIRATLATGYAHYWSRSRASLWKKGESSGETQKVHALYVDCDQDALLVEVTVEGRGSACHNGYTSCFYRKVEHTDEGLSLKTIDTPLVSKADLYG